MGFGPGIQIDDATHCIEDQKCILERFEDWFVARLIEASFGPKHKILQGFNCRGDVTIGDFLVELGAGHLSQWLPLLPHTGQSDEYLSLYLLIHLIILLLGRVGYDCNSGHGYTVGSDLEN